MIHYTLHVTCRRRAQPRQGGGNWPLCYKAIHYDSAWDRVHTHTVTQFTHVSELFEVRRSGQLDRLAFPGVNNSGLGVFTRFRCRLTIAFQSETTVRVRADRLLPQQRVYQCEDGDNPDMVITTDPTTFTDPKSMSWFWRIQHNSENPSHEYVWDRLNSRPHLIPLRILDGEVTFNYNWKKKTR